MPREQFNYTFNESIGTKIDVAHQAIMAKAKGKTCASCCHSCFDSQVGFCSKADVSIYVPSAIACLHYDGK